MTFSYKDPEYKRIVLKKYCDLEGELHLVEINKNDFSSLGIGLVGNKDLSKMSMFVINTKEGYPAAISGQIYVGDQLLEVNGHSLFGRSHLNASPIFNSINSSKVTILLVRSKEFYNHIAILPQSYTLEAQNQQLFGTIVGKKCALISEPGSLNNERQMKLQDVSYSNSPDDNGDDGESFHDIHYMSKSATPECILMKSQHELFDDPRTYAILPGRVNKVKIKKGKVPFGCKIVGGIDVSLRRVLVYEIHEGGAAHKDGRLKVGDEILEVNGQDVHSLTHVEVVEQLQKLISFIELLVVRDVSLNDDLSENNHIWMKEKFFSCKEFSLEFVKRPGRSLGISVVPIWKDRGVLVADVIKGDISEDVKNILSGDEIVAVNGMPLDHLTTKEALLILKTLMGKVSMEIHRTNVGLLAVTSNCPDLYLSHSSAFLKFGSASDLRKSKKIVKRMLPSCFAEGRKQ